jgi:hypothetical protein
MFYLLLMLAFLQSEAADSAAKETQQAREWLLAQRIARDDLSPQQSESLEKKYAELTPPQLRVLIQVFERTYGVQAPVNESLGEQVDEREQGKEWLLAYRIVYDRLTVDQAKAFATEIDQMSSSQIRTLIIAYEQKEALQRQETSNQPESEITQREREARQKLNEAAQRKQAEAMRRQVALGQAADVRSTNIRAEQSMNRAASSAASTQNRRYEQTQSFSRQMYSRGVNRNNNGYGGYGGYGRGLYVVP